MLFRATLLRTPRAGLEGAPRAANREREGAFRPLGVGLVLIEAAFSGRRVSLYIFSLSVSDSSSVRS